MHSKDIRAPVSLLKVKMITLKNSPKLNWCYFAKKKKEEKWHHCRSHKIYKLNNVVVIRT